MDLQMVINDVAAVMYVCSYLTKGEKVMGETLKRVATECRDDDIQTQMKKIKKEFLGKRAFGCPESVMRILLMWLMKKSWKVVTVNWKMKENRVCLRLKSNCPRWMMMKQMYLQLVSQTDMLQDQMT